MTNKRLIALLISLTILLTLGVIGYRGISPTKIAFVNYQIISLGMINKANDNSFIKIEELPTEAIDAIDSYDMVFINGMGLRITEAQRAVIRRAAENGTPIMTVAVTNPENNICSLTDSVVDELKPYLVGGRTNYRSMLHYVRKNIDKKWIGFEEPKAPLARANDLIYHTNIADSEEEDLGFNSVNEYDAFLRQHGLWNENAPRIIVTGAMGVADDLVRKLEEQGMMVYPVNSFSTFVKQHIDSVSPSAVINMAHGRLGDFAVEYLTRQNIPLFSPLNVNRLVESWEDDKLGMSGGFLSQSVATPEIDGAIRPYALFGHYTDNDGLQQAYAIPERLETFVETVANYIKLQRENNREKRVAIYYYKGPGQNALTAAGMEVVPSLYNFLKELRTAGYNVGNLPASAEELGKMIQEQGAVFNGYARGASARYMENSHPEIIDRKSYEAWIGKSIRADKYEEVKRIFGDFPGEYMATEQGELALNRLKFGNIVLLPQLAAGAGENSFKIVHGTDAAPPHHYIASYLWVQHGFKADALIHFGTHGSLEFTPRKQVALSHADWPDRLVGALPHFYIYSIGNVGEGMIAKRRSYAGLQSYLTAPFLESNLKGTFRELGEEIKNYTNLIEDNASKEALERSSLKIKGYAVKAGIHRDLELDSVLTIPYGEEEITRIESFAEEIATEKITGQLYTMGVPYENERIVSSVYAMATEPIAYSLLALDKLSGKATHDVEKHKMKFNARYLAPAKALVGQILTNGSVANDALICRVAGISADELKLAREIAQSRKAPSGMMAMMNMANKKGAPEKKGGSDQKDKMPAPKKEYSKEEINKSAAILELEQTILNVTKYRRDLHASPQLEMTSLLNALKGGFVKPSPGGDPISNPNTIPTGRNLYGINAEATPSESAWEKGKRLAQHTIDMYRKRHNDSIPRKVSYTLWSGEFIETEGATIAQVLYMLGVEPIRDAFGRVTDIRLIPSEELGRARIDVVVQTSGQLRDIAASRLFLINRAVEMAAAANDDRYENQVRAGVVEAERTLIEKGITPKEAREMAAYRVFGGVNGGYGTGIQGMVMNSDRWSSEKEIADTYLNNMGAYYGSEKNWEMMRAFAFEAALTRTDAVIQPRQSNTWGALSLDHVYEFMGGMNLAVRNVTGKEPDAYLSDYRNRNHTRMQEVKEAIGVESRATIFNPTYIKEKMKGGASAANSFAEVVENTFGWNVMKPKAIDEAMWNEIYEVYVNDKFNLGVTTYFEQQNPAALEQITAVMLESVRKGMWNASEAQLKEIAKLHTDLVNTHRPSCSGFVCDNAKLRQFIAENVDEQTSASYKAQINEIREKTAEGKKGMVMKKEALHSGPEEHSNTLNNLLVAVVVVIAGASLMLFVRNRRKNMNGEWKQS